jgi:cell division protein FtsX
MEEETKKEEKQATEKPLDKMTAKELREIALGIPGVAGVHAMKKAELLVAIKEYRGIKDEGPVKKKIKKTDKAMPDVKALKKKITLLRQEKGVARGQRDRKRVDTLRRRINRLKKQTRKAVHA